MKTTDLSLAELRQMLAENELAIGPDAESTRLLRRIVARRERLADQTAKADRKQAEAAR